MASLSKYLQRERDFKRPTADAAELVEDAYQANQPSTEIKFNFRLRKTGVGVILRTKARPFFVKRYVEQNFLFASRLGEPDRGRFFTSMTFFISDEHL